MKKELYECPKCSSKTFNLCPITYTEEDFKNVEGGYDEDAGLNWLEVVCSECNGCYFAFPWDNNVALHAELSMIKEELGEPIKKP